MRKFFRVATEGSTVDGRKISADQLKQMAKNYDPNKYAARVWLEHIRSVAPDSQFKAYGDVIALKTETNAEGKTVLLAQIEPTDELKEINSKKQKLFSSVEIQPDFAESGEAYLIGLAVTDTPASLGTERLLFNACQQKATNLFSTYTDSDLDFSDEEHANPEAESKGILFRVKQLLGKHNTQTKNDTVAAFSAFHADIDAGFEQVITDYTDKFTTQDAKFVQLEQDFKALKDTLDTTPPQTYNTRPPAAGGDHSTATDC